MRRPVRSLLAAFSTTVRTARPDSPLAAEILRRLRPALRSLRMSVCCVAVAAGGRPIGCGSMALYWPRNLFHCRTRSWWRLYSASCASHSSDWPASNSHVPALLHLEGLDPLLEDGFIVGKVFAHLVDQFERLVALVDQLFNLVVALFQRGFQFGNADGGIICHVSI